MRYTRTYIRMQCSQLNSYYSDILKVDSESISIFIMTFDSFSRILSSEVLLL